MLYFSVLSLACMTCFAERVLNTGIYRDRHDSGSSVNGGVKRSEVSAFKQKICLRQKRGGFNVYNMRVLKGFVDHPLVDDF